MKPPTSKRKFLLLTLVLGIALLAIYVETRPRLAPGQAPLTDIDTIETLRMQFNHDAGQVRLIILVAPT
jgi:hypothetical protein